VLNDYSVENITGDRGGGDGDLIQGGIQDRRFQYSRWDLFEYITRASGGGNGDLTGGEDSEQEMGIQYRRWGLFENITRARGGDGD